MKKLQSLNSELFQTMEANEMKVVNGGKYAQVGTRVGTLGGITIHSNGDPASVDSAASPDDGPDW